MNTYDTISGQGTWWSRFTSNKYVLGGKNFLESNGLVAKFAFLILIIMFFIIALRLGTVILSWIFSPSPSPILIDGMIDSRQMMTIAQDPSTKGSIPILRSINDTDGLEFTWSVWIFIDDYTYRQGKYKHIFHKGNDQIDTEGPNAGLNSPNNAPGLYLNKDTNDLVLMMNTFDDYTEKIIVKDIPIHKWVNVIVRVIQHQVDIYINGTLTKRHILNGVPKQNYGDVYVSMNGGFSGYTSELRYFDTGIGTNHIQALVDAGPNTKLVGKDMLGSLPHYLSTRWYFAGADDMYNPPALTATST